MRIAISTSTVHGPANPGAPLPAQLLGTLALDTPDRDGRSYVSAASGLATAGGAAWVVSDELGELIRYDQLAAPGRLVPGLRHHKKKPDLESVLAIPARDGHTTLVAFGSGSKGDHSRDHALVREVDAAGHAVGHAVTASLKPLYDALRSQLRDGPNIEAAVLRGSELLLFHRGRAAGDRNVIFHLDAERAVTALRGGGKVDDDLIRGTTEVDLGELGGERLGFSDAHLLADGRIAFVASAEASDNLHGDGGTIKGSAVGILDANLAVQQLRPIAGPPRKVEGIVPTSDLASTGLLGRAALIAAHAGPLSFTLVTDPDDARQASELLLVDLG